MLGGVPVLIAFAGLLALLAVAAGFPISLGIGALGMSAVAVEMGSRVFPVSAQVMVDGLNSFVLIAAPFFMLAGEIMNTGGMTRRIFRFASALIGRLPGGLGQVNVLASMLFAGMTGSALAEAVALGSMEIKAMRERGYDLKMSAALTAAASTIGPIIPPSVPMVIYGALAGASVGQLFLAGIVPGLLMGGALMLTVYFYAMRGKCPSEARPPKGELWGATKDSLPSLLNPLIVLGGIYGGIFTPTEAAIIVTGYSLFLSILYREMTLRHLLDIVVRVISNAGALFLFVATTSLLGWVIARTGVVIEFAMWLSSVVHSPTILLLLITGLYLFAGLFMEPVAAMILLVPILLPAVKLLHIDLIHFGLVTVLALVLGLLTPPVALVLYAVARIAEISVEDMARALVPFLIPLVIVLLITVLFPDAVLFLPRLVGAPSLRG
jgi:tripartite ATP-independent transporter DctM subunit